MGAKNKIKVHCIAIDKYVYIKNVVKIQALDVT